LNPGKWMPSKLPLDMLQSSSFVVGLAKLIALVVGCTLFTTPELCGAQRYHWPTLAEVLRQNSVPLPPPDVDTAMTITSFGVVSEPPQFAIAYYRDTGTEALAPPLYVLRYDKGARQWYRHEFNLGEIKAPFTDGLTPGQKPLMLDCLGSASISTAAGSLLVSTHLSPSAECTMVLGSDLRLVSTFSGWKVAALGSEIVVERSEIHFAPTHPLRLAVLDLATGCERDLFPPVNDRFRKQFQQRLIALRNEDWCREYNASCDPEQMSTNLDKIAVNPDDEAVAIQVTFSSEGFGPTAQSQLNNEECFYLFKLAPSLTYREFRQSELQRIVGVATPDILVRPEVLQRIFGANNEH
jgi:hypothetical protein